MVDDKKQRTTVFLGENDRAVLNIVKEKYGATSDSEAIRIALHIAANKKRKAPKKVVGSVSTQN